MQKQQNPDPKQDPRDIQREPVRKRDPIHPDDSNDKGVPPPDRHRDPLRQPTDVPDVQPDVIAGRRSGNKDSEGQAADPSAPHSSQRKP